EKQLGQAPLMWAAATSQGPMMRELLAHGAEVDAKSDLDLMTPLVSAEPRAQPRPPGGMTAMLFSAREGCLDCVKALVENGAKVDLPDPEGVTPLITAIFNAHFDVGKYLIEKGANIDRWDWWGRTAVRVRSTRLAYNKFPITEPRSGGGITLSNNFWRKATTSTCRIVASSPPSTTRWDALAAIAAAASASMSTRIRATCQFPRAES